MNNPISSIKLFSHFFYESMGEIKKYFGDYWLSLVALIILGILGCIPWSLLGVGENNTAEIISSLLIGFLSLIVVVNIILIEKARLKNAQKETLIYAFSTYLIYTFYASFFIIAGLFLFIIPGLIAAVFVALAPLASILVEDEKNDYLRLSFNMAKKDFVLVASFAFASLFLEAVSFTFSYISNTFWRISSNVVFSFLGAVLLMALVLTSIKIFYYLNSKLGPVKK